MYLNIFLKCMGLESIFTFDPFPNYRNKEYYLLKNTFNYLYTYVIILLLFYQPCLETLLSVHFLEFRNFPTTLFYYIVPIHYLISLNYFNSQRKKRIYESTDMSFLTNKNEISKCMPEEIILLRTILLISGLIIEWSIFLYLYMDKQYVYYYIRAFHIRRVIILIR